MTYIYTTVQVNTISIYITFMQVLLCKATQVNSSMTVQHLEKRNGIHAIFVEIKKELYVVFVLLT